MFSAMSDMIHGGLITT